MMTEEETVAMIERMANPSVDDKIARLNSRHEEAAMDLRDDLWESISDAAKWAILIAHFGEEEMHEVLNDVLEGQSCPNH